MVNSKNNTNWVSIGFLILSVITILLIIQIGVLQKEKLIVEEPIALLNVEVIGVNENLYNSEEMFYTYRIDNFGEGEARNVKVKCKIIDEHNIEISSVLDYFGNLASNSLQISEATTKNIKDEDWPEDGIYFCYVESCDNCEILYKNIPELIKWYRY